MSYYIISKRTKNNTYFLDIDNKFKEYELEHPKIKRFEAYIFISNYCIENNLTDENIFISFVKNNKIENHICANIYNRKILKIFKTIRKIKSYFGLH